jgi:lysophospholipase L1-like esterase
MRTLGCLCLAIAGVSLCSAEEYSFTLDGKPCHPKILPVAGTGKGSVAPGDIGTLGTLPFVVRGPGNHHFRTDEGPPRRLLVGIKQGPEELAGIVLKNPGDVIPRADWNKTALRVELGSPGLSTLPELPRDLRYLSITCHEAPSPTALETLGGLADLLQFSLELPAGGSFRASLLSGAGQLRNLNIEGGRIVEPDRLSGLASLRFVKLRALEDLDSVAFAANSPELRVLKIDGTAVRDLGPLAGLQNLRLLSANDTPVESLPDLSQLPALGDLRLHSTPVSKDKEQIRPLRPRMSVLVKNWEPAIRAFEVHDAAHPPPDNPILFLGSSSIRGWDLSGAFPGVPAINRGFGGSELSDSIRYFDRVVLPYRPRAILLYAGDNDIGNGESAGQVIADFRTFAAKVRSRLPRTHLAFIPIKPSLKRWELWPEMKQANVSIRDLVAADSMRHYLDTASPMLGEDGLPVQELFAKDGLHLSKEGYALWSGIVRAWLASL